MLRSALAVSLLWLTVGQLARADLVCSRPVLNAGTLSTGKPIRHRFVLVNNGTEPADVTGVKPSCGCLQPKLGSPMLAPGAQTTLDVEVNTVTQAAGPNTWRARVSYRQAGREGELNLLVAANLVPEVTISPAAAVLHTQTAMTYPFTLTEKRARPLEIRSCTAGDGKQVTASVSEPVKEGGNWVRKVTLRVLPGCAEGRHDQVLHIHTADPEYPVLSVPFTVVKRTPGVVQATPAQVALLAGAGQPLPARIILLATADDKPVVVEKVEAGHPAVSCTWANGPGSRATLRVRVDHEKLGKDRLDASVRVHTRQPGGQVINIPVRVER